MADDYDEVFAEIRKHEQPKTHHECRCRDCDPLTAMAERVDAFATAKALLKDGPVEGKWHPEDPPSVREAMLLADWLMYGPSEGD
jgi:hypothetical protein